MKRKIILSTISAVIAIAISTTIMVALMTVSKQSGMITIQTSGVDMSVGAPIVEDYVSLAPGETFTVSVRITNINKIPVVLSGVSLQNITWFDGNNLMNDPQENLQIKATYLVDSQGSTIVDLAPNSYGYLKVTIQLPADEMFAYKTVRFNLKMDFSELA
ncbi:MAG TPA: hypothetical protein GXX46_10120 [Peptococcaceae bacterium]|nr:hypothetical protein [Peptococcaceae bacterium]